MILLLLSRLMPAHPAARMLQFTNNSSFWLEKKAFPGYEVLLQRAQKSCVRVWAVHGHGISEPKGERAAQSPFWWRNVIFGVNHFLLWDPERC